MSVGRGFFKQTCVHALRLISGHRASTLCGSDNSVPAKVQDDKSLIPSHLI